MLIHHRVVGAYGTYSIRLHRDTWIGCLSITGHTHTLHIQSKIEGEGFRPIMLPQTPDIQHIYLTQQAQFLCL